MIKLLNAMQMKEVDAYTIRHEPVSSIDLMERASRCFVSYFINHFPDKRRSIAIYAGTGNNGGDGLAIARMLHQHGYRNLSVKVVRFSKSLSPDFQHNLDRLQATGFTFIPILPKDDFPDEDADIIIDAILGSGLNKPLEGDYARLVIRLNSLNRIVVAVDVPTGFVGEGAINAGALILKSDLVISFQIPKINFLLPESADFISCWEVVSIGLHEAYMQSVKCSCYWVEERDVRKLLKKRTSFQHKGNFGHAFIIAGQPETMGAAMLSSAASVYAGAGLTTVCIPSVGTTAINTYMPEVMIIRREMQDPQAIPWEKFNAVGLGPGIGKQDESRLWLRHAIENCKALVLDADALNILSEDPVLLNRLPPDTILTPHMKEFDRLFGLHQNWWQRLKTAQEQAAKRGIYIVLKNRYTICSTPAGDLYFNSTGNPAMATGGMGDVLTGIITALLAQGYTAEQACIAGTFIHGKAGDELMKPDRLSTVLPGKLAAQIPVTLAKLQR